MCIDEHGEREPLRLTAEEWEMIIALARKWPVVHPSLRCPRVYPLGRVPQGLTVFYLLHRVTARRPWQT